MDAGSLGLLRLSAGVAIPLALLALFLLVLVAVAFAAAKLIGTRDPAGRVGLGGCLAGCAMGLGLLLLATLGFFAFATALALHTACSVIPDNPIDRIYFGTEPERLPGYLSGPEDAPQFADDPFRPLHVVLEIQGHDAAPPVLLDWVHDWSDGEARVWTGNRTSQDGREYTLVDIALPADRRDLRRIEEEVSKYVRDASWAAGLRVDFKSVHREG